MDFEGGGEGEQHYELSLPHTRLYTCAKDNMGL